jgi:hypothetical protein
MPRRRIETSVFKPNHRSWAWCATLNNARIKDIDTIRMKLLGMAEDDAFASPGGSLDATPRRGQINKKNHFIWFMAGIEHGPLRPDNWVTPADYSGNGDTPHLQCAWQTYTDISWAKMIDCVNSIWGDEESHPMFSVFPCNGSDEDQVAYCSKDGDVVIEWGERIACERAKKIGQGKRTDLDDIRDELREGADVDVLREKYFSQFAQFERFFVNYAGRLHEERARYDILQTYNNIVWKPWQKTILAKLIDPNGAILPVKPRTLTCVVDHLGNSGKSYLSTYLAVKHGFLLLNPCGKRDLAYILTQTLARGISPNGVIIDIARSTVGTGLQDGQGVAPNQALASVYNFIECVHDCRIVNTKYEAKTVFFKPMHTLLFTNHDLETRSEYTLSRDRWDVLHLRAGVLTQTTGGQWN